MPDKVEITTEPLEGAEVSVGVEVALCLRNRGDDSVGGVQIGRLGCDAVLVRGRVGLECQPADTAVAPFDFQLLQALCNGLCAVQRRRRGHGRRQVAGMRAVHWQMADGSRCQAFTQYCALQAFAGRGKAENLAPACLQRALLKCERRAGVAFRHERGTADRQREVWNVQPLELIELCLECDFFQWVTFRFRA
ncbi:hypothetical protein D3C79_612210 [compost metagenome]